MISSNLDCTLPSSAVVTETSVVNGPCPTAVFAAALNMYLTYGVRSVTVREVPSIDNSSVSFVSVFCTETV